MNIGKITPSFSIDKVASPFQADLTGQVQKTMLANDTSKPSFQNALSNLVNQVNDVTAAPDTLMRDAMTTGAVDVHDVMIANAKAELLISVTTQVATKVIQAYDKILQIQI